MNPNILLIGKIASGKTTQAKLLGELNYYHHVSLASSLKSLAKDILGCPIDKKIHRKFLQDLGQAYRAGDKDFWCKQIKFDPRFSYVIDDCRFKNEVEFFKPLGFKTIRLVVPQEARLDRVEARGQDDLSKLAELEKDSSENDLNDFTADLTIASNLSAGEIHEMIVEWVKANRVDNELVYENIDKSLGYK